MQKENIFSFIFSKLIFLAIIVSFSYYFLNKFLYKDREMKFPIKYLAWGVVATFLGPFMCAAIYTFGHFTSTSSLSLFALSSFLITVLLSSFIKNMRKNDEKNLDSSGGAKAVLLASLIVPSTTLFLMFLFFLNWVW